MKGWGYAGQFSGMTDSVSIKDGFAFAIMTHTTLHEKN